MKNKTFSPIRRARGLPDTLLLKKFSKENYDMTNKPRLDIKDKPNKIQWLSLSTQHMFAMFGSTILVPYLVNLSPAIALLTSGLGTLVFLLITQGKVPAYLGSSFAFIAPLNAAAQGGGIGEMMVGTLIVSIVYALVALLIKAVGYKWIMKILPPVVVGPVIIVIGLSLAGTAVDMAMNDADGNYSLLHFSVALVTLVAAILFSIFGKGIIGQVSILAGIIVGYIYALMVGIVDLSPIGEAKWIEMPDIVLPFVDYHFKITTDLILLMAPVAIVTISEHIGHQLVLGKIVDRNYIKDPGLHRSILGDGCATLISSLLGGPPKTTYGENIGVLAITKAYSVYVIGGAAVFAIIISFVGKISAIISSIPSAVMGGVSILLFGIIASSGLRMLVDSKIDFENNRNLVIASVILIVGLGGAYIKFTTNFQIQGMALAAILGILLNLILPGGEKEIEDNDESEAETLLEHQNI